MIAHESVRFILASASPARLHVLRNAGFDPEVVVSGVSEGFGHVDTARAVILLAERKALSVAGRVSHSLVLACDSMLEFEGTALGKPATAADAADMWRRFSGERGTLHTGHCLIDTRTGGRLSRLASTLVRFGSPSERELEAYVATGQPLTLAGGFSIDGLAAPFVEGIDGDPSNVLGLSLPLLRRMLDECGIEIMDSWKGAGDQPG